MYSVDWLLMNGMLSVVLISHSAGWDWCALRPRESEFEIDSGFEFVTSHDIKFWSVSDEVWKWVNKWIINNDRSASSTYTWNHNIRQSKFSAVNNNIQPVSDSEKVIKSVFKSWRKFSTQWYAVLSRQQSPNRWSEPEEELNVGRRKRFNFQFSENKIEKFLQLKWLLFCFTWMIFQPSKPVPPPQSGTNTVQCQENLRASLEINFDILRRIKVIETIINFHKVFPADIVITYKT